MKKTKRKRVLDTTPHTTPKGSALIGTLARWRLLPPSRGFRAFLSPDWDLPERLSSYEKEPKSASLLPGYLANCHKIDLLTPSVSMELASAPHCTPVPLTGCQAISLALDRAWALGDAAVLSLFLLLLQGIRRETITWPASARERLDPLIGHYMRKRKNADAPDPAELEDDGTRVQGSLERWALGLDRETAKEWGRELATALECAPAGDPEMSNGTKTAADTIATCAAHDMVTDGYAFALAFLIGEREDVAQAGYSMLRTHLAVQTHRFIANRPQGYVAVSNASMGPIAYSAASRPWTGEVLRAFKLCQPSHSGLLAAECGDPATYERFTEAGRSIVSKDEARRARLRGFLPHLHKIPKSAFSPEPTPAEKEEV